eukprot:125208-Hanusia_phi.AAC.7
MAAPLACRLVVAVLLITRGGTQEINLPSHAERNWSHANFAAKLRQRTQGSSMDMSCLLSLSPPATSSPSQVALHVSARSCGLQERIEAHACNRNISVSFYVFLASRRSSGGTRISALLAPILPPTSRTSRSRREERYRPARSWLRGRAGAVAVGHQRPRAGVAPWQHSGARKSGLEARGARGVPSVAAA